MNNKETDIFVKPNEQNQACSSFAMTRKRGMKSKYYVKPIIEVVNIGGSISILAGSPGGMGESTGPTTPDYSGPLGAPRRKDNTIYDDDDDFYDED